MFGATTSPIPHPANLPACLPLFGFGSQINDASHMHEMHRIPYPNGPLHGILFTVESAPKLRLSKMFSNAQDRAISVRLLDFFRVLGLGIDP